MNAIQELVSEHDAVKLTLRILERIGENVEATGTIEHPDHLGQLFDFFGTFVDRCHHGKEEEFLFPALEGVGISRDGGPVGVMLREHQQGRDHVAAMKSAVNDYRCGDANAARTFTQHAEAYVALLTFHIEKENQVLFPLALKHLPQSDLDRLKTGFGRIETEKIGDGRHKAFHAMLNRLEAIYLQ